MADVTIRPDGSQVTVHVFVGEGHGGAYSVQLRAPVTGVIDILADPSAQQPSDQTIVIPNPPHAPATLEAFNLLWGVILAKFSDSPDYLFLIEIRQNGAVCPGGKMQRRGAWGDKTILQFRGRFAFIF